MEAGFHTVWTIRHVFRLSGGKTLFNCLDFFMKLELLHFLLSFRHVYILHRRSVTLKRVWR